PHSPTSPTQLSPLSLHDALPISIPMEQEGVPQTLVHQTQHGLVGAVGGDVLLIGLDGASQIIRLQQRIGQVIKGQMGARASRVLDRKSTRLNSSHVAISYAVFCL